MTQEMDTVPSAVPQDSRPGRAPETQRTAYHVAGVLLLLYSVVTLAWRGYGLGVANIPVDSLTTVLANPRENVQAYSTLSLYEWGFAAAMFVVALCLFARRTAARGGAIWVACLLLAGVLRQAFGLLSDLYRKSIFVADLGWLVLATYAFSAAVAVVVLVVMLRARESDDVPRIGRAVVYRTAGVLLIVFSLHNLTLTVWNPMLDYTSMSVADYAMMNLRLVFSPGIASVEMISGASLLYGLLATVSVLLIGVFAVLRYRFVRGAAVVVLSLELYNVADMLVFSFAGASWESIASVIPVIAVTLIMPLIVIVALVLFIRDSDKRAATTSHAPGGAALAGDLGEQDAGGD